MERSRLFRLFRWVKTMLIYYYNNNHHRNKNLWVFGAWNGTKYADNSKYLYLYVNKNLPNITPVWITKNKNIYYELKNNNYNCSLIGTNECKQILKSAGYAFFTNSLEDFGPNNYLCGAKIVALFHGVGFKKELREFQCTQIAKILKSFIHYIYCPSYFDLCFTTSVFMKEKFNKQQYNSNLNKIYITGQPRNDSFISKMENEKTKSILYMPTFRSDAQSQIKLDLIIKGLATSEKLNKILKKYDYKFFVKTHFLTNTNLDKNNNIIFLKDDNVYDVQKLLVGTDILITDYSSVANDFSLLERPIVFFAFDLNEYKKYIDDEYNEILKDTYVKSLEELYDVLEGLLENRIEYEATNKIINKFFNDSNLKIGSFSKNVSEIIQNMM
jgi:CDP-glycerol glycerophosphotransferase